MKEVEVPGDKSITHRALMFSALASGRSEIRAALDSADTRSSAHVLRALGVDVPELGSSMTINGVGLHGLRAAPGLLDCGNSGTSVRLLMGIMAGYAFTSRFDGDESLRGRPMRRVTQPLVLMGAQVRELGEPDRLPLELRGGALRAIEFDNLKSSAQVKSAILLAALTGGAGATVREPSHSRDHTERMLAAMGVNIRTVVDHARTWRIEIDPAEALAPVDVLVPGDFSSAAFFLARALLSGPAVKLRNVGVNATRTGFLDVVRRMQGTIHVQDREASAGEPVATLIAEPGRLRGVEIDGPEIPHLIDEVPIIAVLAARAEGETIIRGASELRVKETDRIRAMVENLRAVGVQAEETADGLVVSGSDAPLSGQIRTYGDHRIAMAFGILGSIPGNRITVDDVACVSVSFPTFWKQLEDLKE